MPLKQEHVYAVVVETQDRHSSLHVFKDKNQAVEFVEFAENQKEVANVYHNGIMPTDLEGNCEKLAVWLEDYYEEDEDDDEEYDEEEDDD